MGSSSDLKHLGSNQKQWAAERAHLLGLLLSGRVPTSVRLPRGATSIADLDEEVLARIRVQDVVQCIAQGKELDLRRLCADEASKQAGTEQALPSAEPPGAVEGSSVSSRESAQGDGAGQESGGEGEARLLVDRVTRRGLRDFLEATVGPTNSLPCAFQCRPRAVWGRRGGQGSSGSQPGSLVDATDIRALVFDFMLVSSLTRPKSESPRTPGKHSKIPVGLPTLPNLGKLTGKMMKTAGFSMMKSASVSGAGKKDRADKEREREREAHRAETNPLGIMQLACQVSEDNQLRTSTALEAFLEEQQEGPRWPPPPEIVASLGPHGGVLWLPLHLLALGQSLDFPDKEELWEWAHPKVRLVQEMLHQETASEDPDAHSVLKSLVANLADALRWGEQDDISDMAKLILDQLPAMGPSLCSPSLRAAASLHWEALALAMAQAQAQALFGRKSSVEDSKALFRRLRDAVQSAFRPLGMEPAMHEALLGHALLCLLPPVHQFRGLAGHPRAQANRVLEELLDSLVRLTALLEGGAAPTPSSTSAESSPAPAGASLAEQGGGGEGLPEGEDLGVLLGVLEGLKGGLDHLASHLLALSHSKLWTTTCQVLLQSALQAAFCLAKALARKRGTECRLPSFAEATVEFPLKELRMQYLLRSVYNEYSHWVRTGSGRGAGYVDAAVVAGCKGALVQLEREWDKEPGSRNSLSFPLCDEFIAAASALRWLLLLHIEKYMEFCRREERLPLAGTVFQGARVQDSIVRDLGGDSATKTLLKNLGPHYRELEESTTCVLKVLSSWISIKSEEIDVQISEALRTEMQVSDPDDGVLASADFVIAFLDAYVDQFVKLGIPLEEGSVRCLIRALDNMAASYVTRLRNQVGTAKTFCPAAPHLEGWKPPKGSSKSPSPQAPSGSKSKSKAKDTPPDPNKLANPTACAIFTRAKTCQVLSVRLEELVRMLLGVCQGQWLQDLSLQSLLRRTQDGAKEHTSQLIDAAAARATWAPPLLEELYSGAVAEEQLEPVLDSLTKEIDRITAIAGTEGSLRDNFLHAVQDAFLKAYLRVLLDGGPSRAFRPDDYGLFVHHVGRIREYFQAQNESVPAELMDHQFEDIRKALKFLSKETEELTKSFTSLKQRYNLTTNQDVTGLQLTSSPNDLDIVVRVLSHRADETAPKFLKQEGLA